jgi:hypothetical protein
VSVILGSYYEMPGLSLTLEQAARLFALPPRLCEMVLRDLVAGRRLRRSVTGQYVLP